VILRPYLSAVLLASLLVVPFAGSAPVAGDDDPAQLLRTYLNELSTWRADFRQEVISRDNESIEKAQGRVVLKKPGRFRWDYVEPFERVITADGERVWLYEADLEQVTIRRIDEGLGATPAALLTGAEDILTHFELVEVRAEDAIQWLRLDSRSQNSDFSGIDLAFADGQLVQIYLTDRLGQQTRIFFSNIEKDVVVADDFFRFDIPNGVDVIDEDDI
jgi:outer membrane lipoprotein carrier protein